MDTSNIRLEVVGGPNGYNLNCWNYKGARYSRRELEGWAGENERGENTNLVAVTPDREVVAIINGAEVETSDHLRIYDFRYLDVAEPLRKNGVGTEVVRQLQEEQGFDGIFTNVPTRSTRDSGWYTRRGFRKLEQGEEPPDWGGRARSGYYFWP